MSEELNPAIERLQQKLEQQLEAVRKTKTAINMVCEAFDQPPLYPDVEEKVVALGHIRSDQFYGQPLSTCIRAILEMRRAANRGAATVNELFDGLKAGGYNFETKDDENSKRGLRISLRKNSAIFHKLPGGQWGLLAWYPNAKAATKNSNGDDDDEQPKKNGAKATAQVAAPQAAASRAEEDDQEDDDDVDEV